MSSDGAQSPRSGAIVAVAIGLVGGLALLVLARFDARFATTADDASARVAIGINGVSHRMARDVLLPTHGWVLHVDLPGLTEDAPLAGLEVTLREERTGMSVRIEERMARGDGRVGLTIPKALGLSEGLLAVQARWTDPEGRRSEAWQRLRVRAWLGGPPIGSRQQIELNFESDRDGDGRPDFMADLERLGLGNSAQPELSARLAERVGELALARVVRAYAARDDPNRTGQASDPVRIRFSREAEPGPFVTRICIGGRDPSDAASLGRVPFDLRNEHRSSQECEGEPARGVFSGALSRFADSPLFQSAFDPLAADRGGVPIGASAVDVRALTSLAAFATREAAQQAAQEAADDPDFAARRSQIARAIRVLADALGSLIAHQAGHALGLVAPGKPGVGLFGIAEGKDQAHNFEPDEDAERGPWLMDPLHTLRFEELAGEAESGELRFRPLNYAYLRDRVVLIDGRN